MDVLVYVAIILGDIEMVIGGKKAALCLSGHPRVFRKCFEFLRNNIMEPLNPIIFIHAWYDHDWEVDSVLELYRPAKYKFEKYTKEHANHFSGFFNPTKMRKARETNAEAFASMTYKIMCCNGLKLKYEAEQEHKFDFVIRGRFDTVFSRQLNEQDITLIKPNTIVIPHLHDYHGGLNDMFAIGCSEDMNIYSVLHKYIIDYAVNGCMIHPETMLRHHLVNTNCFNIERINITIQIIRK